MVVDPGLTARMNQHHLMGIEDSFDCDRLRPLPHVQMVVFVRSGRHIKVFRLLPCVDVVRLP